MKVFPRTPHLSWSGHRSSDDLTLTTAESESFLQQTSVVQEKLDGANVSIRVADDRLALENRGKPVSNHAQFDPFKAWVAMHQELRDLGNLILYGEWLYAEHGTPYDQLPDCFIAYDLYDTTTERFLRSADVRDLCGALGVSCVPELPVPRSPGALLQLATARSGYSTTSPREGLYLRIEENGTCTSRAKLVRPGYQPRTNEEWARLGIVPNRRT
jgi:atypical dual specificity phosphatase